ncbi:hypothetical protein C2845_PM01G43620 [Panicum miliaceum]|uniref:Uncharacterized protein n=1 Tax=Panicum miliaceum TaxID=4540 RepID=A0A3L6TI29_PANMI|nr:hypothetical protein C2845_PM01G43620 [Panicum miliaceum]
MAIWEPARRGRLVRERRVAKKMNSAAASSLRLQAPPPLRLRIRAPPPLRSPAACSTSAASRALVSPSAATLPTPRRSRSAAASASSSAGSTFSSSSAHISAITPFSKNHFLFICSYDYIK